jgi:hypothetical protein
VLQLLQVHHRVVEVLSARLLSHNHHGGGLRPIERVIVAWDEGLLPLRDQHLLLLVCACQRALHHRPVRLNLDLRRQTIIEGARLLRDPQVLLLLEQLQLVVFVCVQWGLAVHLWRRVLKQLMGLLGRARVFVLAGNFVEWNVQLSRLDITHLGGLRVRPMHLNITEVRRLRKHSLLLLLVVVVNVGRNRGAALH